MRQVGRLGGLALAALLALGGCDGSGGRPPASSSTEQAKVKGKVTLKGKPLAKVEVRFNPANVNRKSAPTATAIAERRRLLRGHDPRRREHRLPRRPGGDQEPQQLTYFNKSVDVKAGENTVDLAIP